MGSESVSDIQYVHTNLVARDWRVLSQFYIDVFGCTPVPPERHLGGEWLDRLTGVPAARADGIHLRLPGREDGPTLEIFQYTPGNPTSCAPQIDRAGFSHIAFHVSDVSAVLAKLIECGGEPLGQVVETEIAGAGLLTVVYAKDPEGNFIELQHWEKAAG